MAGKPGPEWATLLREPSWLVSELVPSAIPTKPGVYTLLRGNKPVYVGKADSLLTRLSAHRSRGVSMTNSALRRNVAEHLGIASSADIKDRRYVPTTQETLSVTEWIRQGSFKWLVCPTKAEAKSLEDRLKAEWMPPLTKR